MDDVDAVQAQIARNMLESGDWVTARLDGVAYLEKSPLIYWMMAASYRVFGVHDWSARLPLALAVVMLCFVTYRFARWAFGEDAGLYSGLILATSVGLFLFTRILIPDATLTLVITGAIWCWLRLLEPDEESAHARWWAAALGLCLAAGLLLKGLIAVVFPIGTGLVYMAASRQLLSRDSWRKLHIGIITLVTLVVAVPWHVLATIANPPYFVFSLHSGPGDYKGFFWFYFFNEHLLRFLNLRYPRDYNTVPRYLFWLFTLAWFFPWSAYLPGVKGLSFRPATRAGRVRLMALCWFVVVMGFFTFSTTQEYYSMPMYPALALLIGSALADRSRWTRIGGWVIASLSAVLFCILSVILALVWRLPAKGDISQALTQNPELYTLSMGHMADLTLNAFAYLKLPLAMAVVAFGISAAGLLVLRKSVKKSALVIAVSMVIFFQAARVALVRFDAYLGSYPLAEALKQSPPGELIEADAYYAFSSVFFYTNRHALLWNGRFNNLEYGSNAPNAPKVFISNGELVKLWNEPRRYYLLAYGADLKQLEQLVGKMNLHVVAVNAGNYLLSNYPVSR